MKNWERVLALVFALALCLGSAAFGSEDNTDLDALREFVISSKESGDISAFTGNWKMENEPYYLVINDSYEWFTINLYGEQSDPGYVVMLEDCITLCLENGWEQTSLWQTDNGALIDTEGNTLTPVDYIMLLPTPEDELSQTAYFSDDFQDVSINYPIQLNAGPHSNVHNAVSFNAVMEDGTDDYYTNILITFQPINGFDPYMNKGAATAEQYMNIMINDFMDTMCGDYILKVLDDFEFRDNGNNYSIACDLWYDGSFFGDDLSQPVRGHMEVRYYGPTGYALVIQTTALESRLQNYVDICNNMLASFSYDTGWRTAQ